MATRPQLSAPVPSLGCSKDWLLGCYYRRHHAAFSYRECGCWKQFTALFLIDRATRRAAIEIFYSRNQFVIVPWHARHQPALSTPERVEASLSLRSVVLAYAICRLRALEIVFPPFEGDYLTSDLAGYQDWASTIPPLAEHAYPHKPHPQGLDVRRTL